MLSALDDGFFEGLRFPGGGIVSLWYSRFWLRNGMTMARALGAELNARAVFVTEAEKLMYNDAGVDAWDLTVFWHSYSMNHFMLYRDLPPTSHQTSLSLHHLDCLRFCFCFARFLR